MLVPSQIAHKFIILLTISISISFFSGCASLSSKSWPQQTGKVLHEIHDGPIVDVSVVALWKAMQERDNAKTSICYHVESAVTDEDGLFVIPSWRESGAPSDISDKQVHIVAFRSGYQTSELTNHTLSDRNYVYYLRPITNKKSRKTKKKRLKYLLQLVGKTNCDADGNSKYHLAGLYKALLAEAEELASTEDDLIVVRSLRQWVYFVKPPEE